MEIYDSAGKLILSVIVDDDSYRYRAIMGDNELTLKYALAEHVELPLGSYCDYQSERYYLIQPENLKEVHSRDFEYTVTMQTVQAYAKLWKFRNPVDGRLKFPLTAKPKEHLQMFVDNMNARDKGWTIGECIDGTETLINYDHAFCLDALKQMADTFNTEFEINGRQVSLRKVEYNKQQPLALSYGRGKGFKTGVARENSSNNPPVEILFVQGGTQNIDASKYGSSELMLPADGEIGYDGSKFSDEDGFVSTAARWYKVDSDRRSLRRRDKQLTSRAEDSVDLSSIYPKRVGTISEVVTVDKDKNFYDIIDDTIPDSLDYSACLIDGETMTVIFQSGELSGREFDVKYYPAVKDGKKAKRFEIVPAEQDGQVMPGGTFLPVVGDTYAVFHCQLPQAYINDAKTKSGAEWDMFREAVRYMYEHEETEFTFTGDLDGIWSKKDWENIGGRIKLGGYISFSDARFQKEGVLVRITGIKDYINSPHSPEIELSNKTVSASVGSRLQQLEAASVTVEEKHRDAISFTKRRFRDAQETASMLEKALLDNYTNIINPITVRTMQLLVGDESLQFRFVNSRTAPVEVAHQFTYNKATKQLTTAAGMIQHMTLGIKDLSSQHKPSEYKFWSVNSYTSAVLDEPNKKYYLYIKASKSNETAEFLLSEGAIKLDGMAGYYHFLCGVLNSEYDGERSFATLYGFSEVLPGRVTTDRVVSGDGLSYFDMVANAMKLGDRLRFNVNGDGKLVLNGTLVQRSGEEQPIIMYRGQWSASIAYAVNDVVFYIDSENKVSSYICIKATTAGVKPTDTEYWETFAQGIKGDHEEMRFAKNGSTTAAPALDNTQAEPDGWTVMQPTLGQLEYLWMIVCWKYPDGTLKEAWSNPVRITPYDGVDGDSPVMVFRGLYDATKTYYGTKYRVDAVKYQNTYYIARTDAGEFKNVLPTDTSKWNIFGAQFESIATNLLLAEGANIGDWFISGGQIVSTLDGSTLIKLDAKTPKILLQSTQTGGNMGDYNKNTNTDEESTISLDAQNGQVEARSNDGVAYMTANGVFCNHAQTNALPASTGYTHYGSVVGLGFAKVNKSSWAMNEDETIVTGVYGRADNSGTAPSYGGYFNQLKAAGFSKGVYYFTDSDNNHQLSNSNATVVGLVNKGKTNTLYLPRNAHEGEEIEVIQMGQGTVRVDTNDGTHLYDDDSENDYYDIGCGHTGVFRKVKYSINNVTYDIWTVGVYKF